MARSTCLHLVVVLASLRAHAAAPTATVARLPKAPTIDGKIAPGEWDVAVRTTGFQGIAQQAGLLEDRRGTSYCGFTDGRLYLAVVSEMPPDGKLHAKQTNRDSNVVFDESIEIWLDPNRAHRGPKKGDLGFYQLIGNARGTIYDCRFDPTKGAPDVGWNGHWEYANAVDPKTHTWTAELSIPFADLGWTPGKVVGRELGVLIARNFKNPWEQTTWFPHKGAFVSWTEYATLLLTADKPTVQIASLGDKVHQGQLGLALRIANPGPARQAKVTLKATSSDMPGLDDETLVALPAGGAGAYAYRIPAGRFHTDAKHRLELTVADAKSDEGWFRYHVSWAQAPEKRWHVRIGPNPDAAVKLAYYPSYQLVRVRIEPAELGKRAEAIRSATVTVATEAGKQVLQQKMTWEGAIGEQELKVGELPDGTHQATVALDGWREPFVREFRRVHFPWEGNRLGITKAVYPPFEPIRVQYGSLVHAVGRRYQVTGLGLWASVQSLGRELLAEPMALMADGEVLVGDGEFKSAEPHAAAYEGKAEHPAVAVKTRCTTEYDGCMKIELELSPPKAKRELKRLWLDIPLWDREAPLWHVSTTGLRVNPAGRAPKGEGRIWDSTQFPDGNWHGNFKPYAWLGAERRGLCWFADNDAGWELDITKERQAPCLSLHRKGAVLTLRVHLIQKPVTITQPRRIVFGLMASPGKPMPANWRRILINRRQPGYLNFQWMGSEYWGSDEHCSAKYPRNGDLSILSKMHEMRLTGDLSTAKQFIRMWSERNLSGDLAGTTSKSREQIESLLRVSLHRTALRPDYFCAYWEEFHSTSRHHRETPIFANEWSGRYGYGSTGGLVPSYQAFACWWGAEFIRRGIGLYLDNAFPKRAYDPLTTSAYRLPNGQMQPSAGMWAHREYLKRIWVLHRQLAPAATPVLMTIHMTNTHIVPTMVWNDSNLDLEWFYGPEPQQSKYPADLLRAESLGLQTGNIPQALARVDKCKTPEEKAFAERTRFGVLMVHEIKAYMPGADGELLLKVLGFGYGRDDCKVRNYWDEDYPIQASDGRVKSLLLQRGGELLLVLCTWNPKPGRVTLTLDTKTLGLIPTAATDDETTKALPLDGGKLTVPLAGYGVRLVRIK